MTLLPHHAALIAASGISDEVRDQRGYHSVTVKAELRRLGFGAAQQSVPGLVIPIHDVRGEVALYQARPDRPRISSAGKPLKYEFPGKARMALDVPVSARGWLADPSRPLYITEGARKADAAVSRGLCCIAVAGVW